LACLSGAIARATEALHAPARSLLFATGSISLAPNSISSRHGWLRERASRASSRAVRSGHDAKRSPARAVRSRRRQVRVRRDSMQIAGRAIRFGRRMFRLAPDAKAVTWQAIAAASPTIAIAASPHRDTHRGPRAARRSHRDPSRTKSAACRRGSLQSVAPWMLPSPPKRGASRRETRPSPSNRGSAGASVCTTG
jgi:hypothetical protein